MGLTPRFSYHKLEILGVNSFFIAEYQEIWLNKLEMKINQV